MTDHDDPTEDTPPLTGRKSVSRSAQRADWRQEALYELEDLGDLWGLDLSQVRL